MSDGRAVKVVCSRGHDEVLLGRLDYRDEDTVYGPVPEDFAPGDPRRAEEPTVLHAGTTVRGLIREERPDRGTKSRARCRRCRLDLPMSWDTLNRSDAVRRLRDAGVTKVELYQLIRAVAG